MKRVTLLFTLIICVLIGIQAQKTNRPVTKEEIALMLDIPHYSVSNSDNTPKFTTTGKILLAKNIETGTQIDIYSMLGAKVYSFTYTGNPVLLNLSKGIYIVRVDKFTQKIIL